MYNLIYTKHLEKTSRHDQILLAKIFYMRWSQPQPEKR